MDELETDLYDNKVSKPTQRDQGVNKGYLFAFLLTVGIGAF